MDLGSVHVFIFFCTFDFTSAAHILGLPLPFRSHSLAMMKLLEQVHKFHGHTSAMVLPDYFINDDFLTKQDYLTYFVSKNYSKVNIPELEKLMTNSGFDGDTSWQNVSFNSLLALCGGLLTEIELISELKEQKFDIAIVDNYFNCPCISILPYKFDIPYLHFGRMMELISLRLPVALASTPSSYFYDYSNPMTFKDRVFNVLFYHLSEIVPYSVSVENAVEIYAPEKPYRSKHEMKARAEMNLIDTDILMDWPYTILPNVVHVGGLTTGPANPLNGNLAKFMDKATSGVVIISFGSLVTTMPHNIVTVLHGVFQKMKDIYFVVKISDYSFEEKNVFSLEWLPQNDLLGHKNCKVFITHCGNRGQFEALYHGVPMIGLPLFADQHYNARRMKMREYGLNLDITTVTSECLATAIQEVITSPVYKTNIGKASEIFRNRPQSPAERAAFWVDHTIKYGGKHLRPAPPDEPYYQYRLIDVYGFLLMCLIVLLVTMYKLTRCLVKLICKEKKAKED